MAQFLAVSATALNQNRDLREYVLAAKTIAESRHGNGTFISGAVAPQPLQSYGIILRRGGMILPHQGFQSFCEGFLKWKTDRKHDLKARATNLKMTLHLCRRDPDRGVVGIWEDPEGGKKYRILLPTPWRCQHSREVRQFGIGEIDEIDHNNIKISIDPRSPWWVTPDEDSPQFALSNQARFHDLGQGLWHLHDSLTDKDLGEREFCDTNIKRFAFNPYQLNYTLVQAKELIERIIVSL